MNGIYYRGPDGNIHMLGDYNELQHWKYIKRIKQGKSYRYFYSMDELKAYLGGDTKDDKKNSNVKSEVEKIKKKANGIFDKIAKYRKLKQKSDKGTKNKSEKEKTKEFPKAEKVSGIDENGHKYIARVEIDGKYRYFYSEDEYQAYTDREKYFAEEPSFMKDVKHSDVPYTSEEDANSVNPKFNPDLDFYNADKDDLRYNVNCAECTAIYELRRRGYDVESNGFTGIVDTFHWKYNTEDRFNIMYENPKVQHTPITSTPKETQVALQKEFDKQPPGSRGDLSFMWSAGGGHSVVWEKDKKGNVRIIDTQASGKGVHTEYDIKTLSYCIDNSSYGPQNTASITRTDNLKLKKGITKIYSDSEKKNKPTSNHIQKVVERQEYNLVFDTWETKLDVIDKVVKLSKKERQIKYPEIGSKSNNKTNNSSNNKKTNTKVSSIKALRAAGFSYEDIARKLGISVSTVSKYL